MIELAIINKTSKTFKTRNKTGERPIGIKQQREILSKSNKWDSSKNQPIVELPTEEE